MSTHGTKANLTTDDIAELGQAVAAYAHRVDAGDGPGFAALFTDDAHLDLGVTSVGGGRDELAAFAASVPQRVPGIRHVITTLLTEGRDDGATVHAYLQTFREAGHGEPATLVAAQLGRYRFDFRRTDAGWRMSYVECRTATLVGQR